MTHGMVGVLKRNRQRSSGVTHETSGKQRARQRNLQRSPKAFLRRAESVLENMLSNCANQQCRKPFLRLREGKLFLVETDRLTKPGEPAVPPFVRARRQQ